VFSQEREEAPGSADRDDAGPPEAAVRDGEQADRAAWLPPAVRRGARVEETQTIGRLIERDIRGQIRYRLDDGLGLTASTMTS